MKKNEQAFCSALGKWWDYVGKDVFAGKTLVCEAKVSIGKDPFNYKSGIKPHQIPVLLQYKSKAMHWKISDFDAQSTKHFDILMTCPEVTIPCFPIMWIRRGNKTFYLLDPDVIKGRIEDGKKSLYEEEANKLCFYKGEIK